MSVLDQIKSGIDELVGSPSQGKETSTTKTTIMSIVVDMIADGKIGLHGLINKFHKNGMSNQVNSWVGTGKNEVVSATEVEEAIGRDNVQTIASEAGLPIEEASHQLAKVLPTMIDRFTPNGEIPEPEVIHEAASQLRGRLSV